MRFPLLTLTLLLSLPSQAQPNRYAQQIEAMFSILDLALLERGYVRSHDRQVDALPANGRDVFTLRLQAFQTYHFLGLCDEDCGDLDLALYAPAGGRLVADIEPDEYPMFEYRPTQTATYQVQAHMYRCSTEPCYYGIGVYRK